MSEQGAFWALVAGLVVGGTRFILEFSFPAPLCYEGKEDDRPNMIKNFHYLYFAIFLFALTLIVAVVVSLLTPPIDEIHVRHLLKPPQLESDLSKTISGVLCVYFSCIV